MGGSQSLWCRSQSLWCWSQSPFGLDFGTLDLGLGLENNRLSSENFMQKKMVLSVTKDKVS